MKVGETILIASNLDDTSTLREHVITKVGADTITCGTEIFYSAFAWPIACKYDLIQLMETRAKLKKAYDDSATLIYELRNKVARGEYNHARM